MSEHVSYEMEMLVETATKLIEGPPPVDQGTHNALIESFLLHLRQLYQFFYYTPGRDTDAAAVDYLPSWPETRPREPKALRTLSDATSKKAVHLTVHRLKRQTYDVRRAGHDLLEVTRAFLKAVDAKLYTTVPKTDLEPGWADPANLLRFAETGVTTTTSPSGGGFVRTDDGWVHKE